MHKTLLLLLILPLVACNKPPQDVVPADPSASLPSAGPAAPPPPPAKDYGVVVVVTPVKTADCTPATYVADVSWTIPAGVTPDGFELRVESPQGGLLALQNSAQGTKQSGPWVTSGTPFFIVDKRSGNVVGQARAPAYDCR